MYRDIRCVWSPERRETTPGSATSSSARASSPKDRSQAKVLCDCGWVDKGAIRRPLSLSIGHFLEPKEAAEMKLALEGTSLRLAPVGPLPERGFWTGSGAAFEPSGSSRGPSCRDSPVELECLVFALMTNLALAPSLTPFTTEWMVEEVGGGRA